MMVRMPGATSIAVGMTMGLVVACGVVGPPVPPEGVGVSGIIQQQKKQEKLELLKQRRAAAGADFPDLPLDQLLLLEGQDVNLPPLRPVGTR